MYQVYLLRGNSGRHYIGMTSDLKRRLDQHQRGQTYTTRRLGGGLQLVASMKCATRQEAVAMERRMKSWRSPEKVRIFMTAE